MREIERKFLVVGEEWKALAKPVRYVQGYLASQANCTVRIRIVEKDAFLTIKGKTTGITRTEFEYSIPYADADILLSQNAIGDIITKDRYHIPYQGFVWEVDAFLEKNTGLYVAEIELPDEGTKFQKPAWVGAEVSDKTRYRNSGLAQYPFASWSDREKVGK